MTIYLKISCMNLLFETSEGYKSPDVRDGRSMSYVGRGDKTAKSVLLMELCILHENAASIALQRTAHS